MYNSFEENEYKFNEWFSEDDWNTDTANVLCDWIYTKVYQFKDF